jgi:hypothetical protein
MREVKSPAKKLKTCFVRERVENWSSVLARDAGKPVFILFNFHKKPDAPQQPSNRQSNFHMTSNLSRFLGRLIALQAIH